jgi:hypothetical protein
MEILIYYQRVGIIEPVRNYFFLQKKNEAPKLVVIIFLNLKENFLI